MFYKLIIYFLTSAIFQCPVSTYNPVNIENNWYLHQGSYTFYRFFRDKITWFEADAVCQFNHAHLVTISNSFEFDRAKEYLTELDVNDIVWIGLKRTHLTGNFYWTSNSHPESINTGYWAESLPACNNPLCVTLDPLRDFRWHALRCSGPETASFLCEMPVPDWLQRCIIKDIPDVIVQYKITTGEVFLSRICGETKLTSSCEESKSIDAVYNDLMCEHDPKKNTWDILKDIHTNNTEDNKILVEKILETFQIESKESVTKDEPNVVLIKNSDEIMLGDQPMDISGDQPLDVQIANEIEDIVPLNNVTSTTLQTTISTETTLDTTTTPQQSTTLNGRNFPTIGHPMYPMQPKAIIITTNETGHVKESYDNHFIPPMLMVKSHYQSPKAHDIASHTTPKETTTHQSTTAAEPTESSEMSTEDSTFTENLVDTSTQQTQTTTRATEDSNFEITNTLKNRKRSLTKLKASGYLKRMFG